MGYKSDSKKVKDINGLQQILIDLKPDRCDSDVYINQKFNVSKIVNYIENKKEEGFDITYFYVFLTVIGKLFYNRNKLNYFVANRHLYEHNDIRISFVAKVDFSDDSKEVMIMLPILPGDNIFTISKRVKEKIERVRNSKERIDGLNQFVDCLGKVPNIVRVPLVGIFKWLDKKGILPNSLIKDNIYYSSIIISNLGSIKCGAIYHNLTNFGTCSSLATVGEIKKEKGIDGKVIDVCEFGVNFDERVADGYYFVKSLKLPLNSASLILIAFSYSSFPCKNVIISLASAL